eukprot:NODE_30679_length_412_cov_3.515789.p6 GENE.NODE_30679_length_412_cov_3.515789~~NODE_30679_length_412_cov_3.515789.p6  ORF type:complete len:50 (+),score=6.27 NODE_30679_length_412_cov_3.515789:150-299(+)
MMMGVEAQRLAGAAGVDAHAHAYAAHRHLFAVSRLSVVCLRFACLPTGV